MPSGSIRNLELPKLVRTLAAPKMQKQPSILGRCWHTSCCLVQALPELELTRRHGVKGLSVHRLNRKKKKAKANSTLRKIIPQAQFVCVFFGGFWWWFFWSKDEVDGFSWELCLLYSTSGHK